MKEDIWTIRKMREEQKLSTTRNTYKLNADKEYSPEAVEVISAKRASLFSKIGGFFMLFLEEG